MLVWLCLLNLFNFVWFVWIQEWNACHKKKIQQQKLTHSQMEFSAEREIIWNMRASQPASWELNWYAEYYLWYKNIKQNLAIFLLIAWLIVSAQYKRARSVFLYARTTKSAQSEQKWLFSKAIHIIINSFDFIHCYCLQHIFQVQYIGNKQR